MIEISAAGEREFEVRVGESRHHVTVPDRIGDAIDPDEHGLETVVRVSFEFLLEREPASSILPRFSLTDISRYFPEYPDELARRLG
ncbi:MAG TPA: hypothetical protein VFO05_14980 [Candidatus Limnocylindrales bacterium]|nr:hypothetical protein [Candidatus Limnocylindrales bacterium]